MQSFLSRYQIPFTPFQEILMEYNALVAGSAALSLYLDQEESPLQFEPNDLDIWVDDSRWKLKLTPHPLIGLLTQNGYIQTQLFNATPDDYGTMLHSVSSIQTYMNGDKKVQLIFVRESNLVKYITSFFDLSVCMTWWNATDDCMESQYPSDTLNGLMYVFHMHSTQLDKERQQMRIAKYLSRGFKKMTMFPMYQIVMDPLEDLTGLHDVQAFDTIEYEEVSAQEHIKRSRWNCLVKVGDQFQAYERCNLYDYIVGHTHHLPIIGAVCDLPYKQSLVYGEYLEHILSSDFTIYELIPEYTLNGKSIHTLRAYTVKGWKTKSYGYLFTPPPVSLESPSSDPYFAWPTDTSISTQDVQEWDSLYAEHIQAIDDLQVEMYEE